MLHAFVMLFQKFSTGAKLNVLVQSVTLTDHDANVFALKCASLNRKSSTAQIGVIPEILVLNICGHTVSTLFIANTGVVEIFHRPSDDCMK